MYQNVCSFEWSSHIELTSTLSLAHIYLSPLWLWLQMCLNCSFWGKSINNLLLVRWSDVIWVMARQLNLQLLYHECFPNCQASLQINGIGEFSLFQPLYLYEEFIKSCTTKHCTTTEILIPSFVEKEIFSLRFSETSLHISNHTDLKSLIKDCWNISACSKQ